MRAMQRFAPFAFVLVNSLSLSAHAEAEHTISSPRILLRDVTHSYDAGALSSLDLGPAPPPGNSRLLSRLEVEDQLRAAGDDAKSLRMPSFLRITSSAKRWSAEELRDALTPKVIAALPIGVQFKASKFTRPLMTSPNVTVGSAHFPKFPRREGELTLTVTVDLEQDTVTVMRVPLTIVVQITEAATRPAITKGARVNLVIEHGPARVSALATALSDTELGEVGLFRVATTLRVLRARLQSPDSAQVVE